MNKGQIFAESVGDKVSLEGADALPSLDVLAASIVEDLQTALE